MPSSSLLRLGSASSSCLKRVLYFVPAAATRRTGVVTVLQVRQYSVDAVAVSASAVGSGPGPAEGDITYYNDNDYPVDNDVEVPATASEGRAQPRATSYNRVKDLEYLETKPALPNALNPYLPQELRRLHPSHMAPLRPLPRSKPLPVVFREEQDRSPGPLRHAMSREQRPPLITHNHRLPPPIPQHWQPKQQQQQRPMDDYSWKQEAPPTVAEFLYSEENVELPPSPWVQVSNIPPNSSLESMLQSVDDKLNDICATKGGLLDLEAPVEFDSQNGVSFPRLPELPVQEASSSRFVHKARLRLSPFGRPNGWFLKLANPSVVYALTEVSKLTRLKCAWKDVIVEPFPEEPKIGMEMAANSVLLDDVSDCTVRMEEVDPKMDMRALTTFFSRFDLSTKHVRPIVPWCEYYNQQRRPSLRHPVNGRPINVPRRSVYLVHFASPAWARAAIREQQGFVFKGAEDYRVLKLAQYPRQIF